MENASFFAAFLWLLSTVENINGMFVVTLGSLQKGTHMYPLFFWAVIETVCVHNVRYAQT